MIASSASSLSTSSTGAEAVIASSASCLSTSSTGAEAVVTTSANSLSTTSIGGVVEALMKSPLQDFQNLADVDINVTQQSLAKDLVEESILFCQKSNGKLPFFLDFQQGPDIKKDDLSPISLPYIGSESLVSITNMDNNDDNGKIGFLSPLSDGFNQRRSCLSIFDSPSFKSASEQEEKSDVYMLMIKNFFDIFDSFLPQVLKSFNIQNEFFLKYGNFKCDPEILEKVLQHNFQQNEDIKNLVNMISEQKKTLLCLSELCRY